MHRLWPLALLVALLASALGPARPSPAAPAGLTPAGLGMVIRDPWYEFDPALGQPTTALLDQMGQLLAAAGVRWVRTELFVQGDDPAAIERNISRYDYFIQTVAPRHSLQILGLLSFGLLRDVDPLDPARGIRVKTTADPLYGGGVNPYMVTWLDRALAVTERYRGQIHAYEILNEQNRLPGHGGDGIGPVEASRLHTKFYRFFKEVNAATDADPAWRAATPVIIGGLHPRGTTAGPAILSDRAYLRAYYSNEAFQGFFTGAGPGGAPRGVYPADGLAYHPYPVEIRLSAPADDVAVISARIAEIRAVLAEIGAADLPIWITEIGYNLGYGGQTEQGQAEFLRLLLAALAATSGVATIFWFKYEDFPGPPREPQLWGVVHIPFTPTDELVCPGGACYAADGRPTLLRPSFRVLQEFAGVAPVMQSYLPLVHKGLP